ncbi:DUF368 domain-containing protein [Pseudonocardia humida]|uniref:DUF368 domain-containing protein n=1 Tax=Pseudonocardia humida TaxID=2800819 RepID=A0ABT1A1U3_9PSEU|nr:DUF368 domain-containing protein [Pseudonocardia humida]MCO1656962.1 DUF368 domain-containing protein [Pseudonocardia humida]
MLSRMSGINLARGAAIGVVEAVPGVSGGTMALVVGIYERLIAQGGHLVGAARAVLPGGRARPRDELRRLDWALLVPVAAGMVLAVVVASRVLPDLIEAHPVGSRAVFFGMVAASVAVPLRITGMLRGVREWVLVVVAFAVTFVVSGLPPAAGEGRPPYWLVGIAAAIAICALVLPGFSGSFLLLVFGLYEPTLRAVAEFDLAYLAVFGLGALIGLGSFVALLQWLLEHHHRTLMVVVAGVLLGALRALWPWQDDVRGLLLPDPSGIVMVVPALLGAALVVGIMLLERRLGTPAAADPQDLPTVPIPRVRHQPDPYQGRRRK